MIATKFLLFILISLSYSEADPPYSSNKLEDVFETVTDFFEKLKKDYEHEIPSTEVINKLDNEIDKYVENLKIPNIHRSRRQVNNFGEERNDLGTYVLSGFQSFSSLRVPGALDVSFFMHQHGAELEWFAVALNSTKLTLLRLNANIFHPIYNLSLSEASCLDSESLETVGTIMAIGCSKSGITILRLYQDKPSEPLSLHLAQHLEASGNSRPVLWRGMNQLFLGVSNPHNITIYHWLGENFDSIQTISNIGAEMLVPFRIGGSMHLAAMSSRSTIILRFLLRSSEFIVVQKLPSAKDIVAFEVGKERLREHYVVLSLNKGSLENGSTIIYKYTAGRFVPFQELLPAQKIFYIPSSKKDTAVLLLSPKDQVDSTVIFQYDGWRFEPLDVNPLRMNQLRPVSLQGEDFIAIENATSEWTLLIPIWSRRNTWGQIKEDITSWCLEARNKLKEDLALLTSKESPLPDTIRIRNGAVIDKLYTKELIGNTTMIQRFVGLSEQYKTEESKLLTARDTLINAMSVENTRFVRLNASTVKTRCTSNCRAQSTVTEVKSTILEELRRLDTVHTSNVKRNTDSYGLELEHVKVDSVGSSLPCPKAILRLNEVILGGDQKINGVSLKTLWDDTLKITGDQEITGDHVIYSLTANSASIPLGIASQTIQTTVQAKTITTKDLHLTEAGLLLPLNGSPVSITGQIQAPKVRIRKVHLRAGVKGEGIKVLAPMAHVPGPLTLPKGTYFLKNVTIASILKAGSITLGNGTSLNAIVENSVPLQAAVPVHFVLDGNTIEWSRVTLESLRRVLTTSPGTAVNITGKKFAPGGVTLPPNKNTVQSVPRIKGTVCGKSAVTSDISTETVRMGRVVANSTLSNSIFGAMTFYEMIMDTVTSASDIDFSSKNILQLRAKKISPSSIRDFDFKGLKNLLSRWSAPGKMKGSVKVSNLSVHSLFSDEAFNVPLPPHVGNVVSKRNAYVNSLGNINIKEFMEGVVITDTPMTLKNLTFAGNLTVGHMQASHAPSILQNPETNSGDVSLGSKTVEGPLEIQEGLTIPHSFVQLSNDAVEHLIIRGSAVFKKEPTVETINEIDINKLISNDIWMIGNAATLSAETFEFKNSSFHGPVSLNEGVDSPGFGSWENAKHRVLSKSESQEISVEASFDHLRAPGVATSESASPRLLVPETSILSELQHNTLKKNATQTVNTSLGFEELHILGDPVIHGTINDMNLTTDVMRSDVEKNILSGTTTVNHLIAEDVESFNFSEWSSGALITNKAKETIVIKGRKTFTNFNGPSLKVAGKVAGYTMESLLSRTNPQEITGKKTIKGIVKAPAIILDGFVNDVNLTSVIEYQLTINASRQTIRTEVRLQGDLEIFGNVTMKGLYQGVELTPIADQVNGSLTSVLEGMQELTDLAEIVDIALQDRAVHFHKLALPEDQRSISLPESIEPEVGPTEVKFDDLGTCTRSPKGTLDCDNEELRGLLRSTSTSGTILNEIIPLGDRMLLLSVSSHPDSKNGHSGVSIFSYDRINKKSRPVSTLPLMEPIRAISGTADGSLWIAVQQPSRLVILRCEPWGAFREYVIPGSSLFLMNKVHTGELLVFRSDGVWRIGGLAGPRSVFHLPQDTRVGPVEISHHSGKGTDPSKVEMRYLGN
ncbi:uncharacterized protein LOC105699370 isoform X2 [Orussus abietinus]|uniref:uncharacterized protein LOC105699370 isoform X2 n=1 Tax=Orussus abietinus TaxID=222816 RepID=UPI0006252E4A|nr:uncharacterized protein LOC105699370 isoform X2 [Orussus abietinus]